MTLVLTNTDFASKANDKITMLYCKMYTKRFSVILEYERIFLSGSQETKRKAVLIGIIYFLTVQVK